MTSRATLALAISLATALVAHLGSGPEALAHCQIPCGIYHDHMRVAMMREDVTTITKAMNQIRDLAGKTDPESRALLTRWTVVKEDHAEKLMRTISDYFMAQKIKPATDAKGQKAYLTMLERHHRVMVAAMKTKQSVDPKNAEELGKTIDAIAPYWKDEGTATPAKK